MNDPVIIDEHKIESMFYELRGQQVMLDSDLARLYQCANGTKTVNLAVKRHIDRFPEDFYFQVTKEEFDNLKFQVETSSWNDYGGIRKLPYAFTEQGVAMLFCSFTNRYCFSGEHKYNACLCCHEKIYFYQHARTKIYKRTRI